MHRLPLGALDDRTVKQYVINSFAGVDLNRPLRPVPDIRRCAASIDRIVNNRDRLSAAIKTKPGKIIGHPDPRPTHPAEKYIMIDPVPPSPKDRSARGPPIVLHRIIAKS